MFCSKCGAEIPQNAKFCDKCGAPVSQGNRQSYGDAQTLKNDAFMNERPSERKRKWPIIAGVIIGILILLAIIGASSSIDPVESLKNGRLTSISSTITIGEALENRFEDCTWTSRKSTAADDIYDIFFNGYDPASSSTWKITFVLTDNGDDTVSFNVDTISVDGELEYDPTVIYYMLDYVYTGNMDKLTTDLGLALWDAIFSSY